VGEYVSYAWNLVQDEIKGMNWINLIKLHGEAMREHVNGIASGGSDLDEYQPFL